MCWVGFWGGGGESLESRLPLRVCLPGLKRNFDLSRDLRPRNEQVEMPLAARLVLLPGDGACEEEGWRRTSRELKKSRTRRAFSPPVRLALAACRLRMRHAR